MCDRWCSAEWSHRSPKKKDQNEYCAYTLFVVRLLGTEQVQHVWQVWVKFFSWDFFFHVTNTHQTSVPLPLSVSTRTLVTYFLVFFICKCGVSCVCLCCCAWAHARALCGSGILTVTYNRLMVHVTSKCLEVCICMCMCMCAWRCDGDTLRRLTLTLSLLQHRTGQPNIRAK